MKSNYRILISVSLMVLILFLTNLSTFSCTNMSVGKNASVDGSVMNMGSQEGACNPNIVIVPRQKHEPGTMAPVYLNMYQDGAPESVPVIKVGEIPQVEETYAYFHAGFPFMNEYQVFISDEYLPDGKPELVNPNGIMDSDQLMVFALQRGKTAREAIQVAGALAEEYGYSANYGGPESWSVTDPNEAWWFEVFGGGADWYPGCGRPGAVWVAQRVPDDHVAFNENRSRIGEIDLDDTDYFMGSSNIYSLAEDMGYWKPGEPFVWYEVYASYGPEGTGPNVREWTLMSLVAPSLNPDPNQERWPFSVKPDKKLSVHDLMEFQKNYLEGTHLDPTVGPLAGPWGSPDRIWNFVLPWKLSQPSASYHLITQARNWLPNPIGGLMWFGFDKPHTSVQMPIYCGITELPKNFSNQTRHYYQRESAYWPFTFVSNWANLCHRYMIEDIKEARAYLMKDMFDLQPAIEETAVKLYEQDPELAIRFLTRYSVDTANRVVDYWREFGDELLAKYVDGGIVGGPWLDYPEYWWDLEAEFREKYVEEFFKNKQ